MAVVLRTDGLSKRFGKFTAVDGLSLTVNEGDLYGFLGLNGAGKSTTMRMALNLMRPSAGAVYLFEKEIRANFLSVMGRVGALVELPAYYPHLSGLANVELLGRLSGGVTRKDALDILERVGLAEKSHIRVADYSMGMGQRLGIAMALVARPALAILDEPTNGLDPHGVVQIRTLIKEWNKREGTTFFISSHLLHEIELTCNRVGIIRAGKLMVEDDVQRLLATSAVGVRLRAAPADKVEPILRSKPYVRSVKPDGDGFIVALDAADFARLNGELVGAGLAVSEFSPHRPSLEEFFMTMQEAA